MIVLWLRVAIRNLMTLKAKLRIGKTR